MSAPTGFIELTCYDNGTPWTIRPETIMAYGKPSQVTLVYFGSHQTRLEMTTVRETPAEIRAILAEPLAPRVAVETLLNRAYDAAVAYIEECPCDPDIYPVQFMRWEEYLAAKAALTAALTPDAGRVGV